MEGSGRIHGHIVEALRRVVSGAIGTTQLGKRGCGVMNRVLSVCKATPVTTVDEEDRHRES